MIQGIKEFYKRCTKLEKIGSFDKEQEAIFMQAKGGRYKIGMQILFKNYDGRELTGLVVKELYRHDCGVYYIHVMVNDGQGYERAIELDEIL